MRALYRLTIVAALSSAALGQATSAAPAAPVVPAKPNAAQVAKASAAYGRLPLSFAPNQGQAAAGVDFVAQGPGYGVSLQPDVVTFRLHQASPALSGSKQAAGRDSVVRMNVLGGDRRASFTAEQKLPGSVNYMLGSTPSKWQIGVPTYAETRVHSIYPSVDLAYYGTEGQLEYDFVVHPGASPSAVRLGLEGTKPSLAADGSLSLLVRDDPKAAPLQFHKPVMYQEVDGSRKPVDGAFTLAANGEVGFRVGTYDHSRDLVIDPYIVYCTYFGGPGNNSIYAAALNASNDLYIAGATSSTLPGQDESLNVQTGNPLAFVSKISATGSSVLWTTVLGGVSEQYVTAIAVSASDEAYITGLTGSQNGMNQNGGNLPGQAGATNSFPITSNAFQALCGPVGTQEGDFQQPYVTEISGCGSGQPDAFISRLSSNGQTLIYSTFLGGSQNETSNAIALDTNGNIYVAGVTNSNQFAPTLAGTSNGCSIPAYPQNMNGVAGLGYSDFPTTANAYNQSYTLDYAVYQAAGSPGQTNNCAVGYGSTDIPFFTEMSADGSKLLYSTTFGGLNLGGSGNGTSDTYLNALALSAQGIAYVAGATSSSGFALAGPQFSGACVGNSNGVCSQSGYLAAFDPAKSGPQSLVLGTYLVGTKPYPTNSQGGSVGPPPSNVSALTTDPSGNVYVAGNTFATDFPTTAGVFQPASSCVLDSYGYCTTAFLAKLSGTGSTVWSTQYEETPSQTGGSTTASGVGVDSSGNVYLVGRTCCTTALKNPISTTGCTYLAKFNSTGTSLIFGTYLADGCYPVTLATGPLPIDAGQNVYLTGSEYANNGSPTIPLTANAFDTSIKNSYAGFIAKVGTLDTTAATLLISPTTATAGANITLTTTIKNVTGTSVPTGFVTLYENNVTVLGIIPVNSSGVAVGSGPSTAFPAGTYNVQARYSGDSTDLPSDSAEVQLTLNHATVTTITASPTTVTPPASTTVTATVKRSDGTGVPTGTVSFYVQTTKIGQATLSAGGVGKLTQSTSGIGAGQYPVYAVYSGDTKDGASTSGNVVVTVQ